MRDGDAMFSLEPPGDSPVWPVALAHAGNGITMRLKATFIGASVEWKRIGHQ